MSEKNKILEPKQHKDLIREHEIFIEQVKTMQVDATTARAELAVLSEQIADAQLSERPKLIQQRGELVDKSDALSEALQILICRRDAAHLALYEFQVVKMETEARRLDALSRKARQQLILAMETLQKFRNAPRPGDMTEAKRDNLRIELETQLARFKAESSIAHRDAIRAGYVLEKATNEKEAVRQKLGIEA